MVYAFTDYEIDRVRAFEKGADAGSKIYDGLWVNVDALFNELLSS